MIVAVIGRVGECGDRCAKKMESFWALGQQRELTCSNKEIGVCQVTCWKKIGKSDAQ